MDWCWVTMLVVSSLLVIRPDGLASIIMQVPVLNALRWPHKEMYLVLFFSHLLMIYAGSITLGRVYQIVFIGVSFFVGFLLPFEPPSLGSQKYNRNFYFSKKAEVYWLKIKKIKGDRAYILPIIDQSIAEDIYATMSLPGILTGTHNFPALFQVKSWSGYSGTLPSAMYERVANLWPLYLSGGYVAKEFSKISELNDAAIIWSKSSDPLKIMMQNDKGEWIDLTPAQ